MLGGLAMDEFKVRIDHDGVIRLPAKTKMRLGPSLDNSFSICLESRKFLIIPVEDELDEELLEILAHEGIII
jgi:hypothetical protein